PRDLDPPGVVVAEHRERVGNAVAVAVVVDGGLGHVGGLVGDGCLVGTRVVGHRVGGGGGVLRLGGGRGLRGAGGGRVVGGGVVVTAGTEHHGEGKQDSGNSHPRSHTRAP